MKKLLLILLISSVGCAQNEGTINSAGSKLYYRTFGSGKPLLIINGGPGMNSNGFVSIAQTLSDHYKTILYDQRGTGKSTLEKSDSTTITMDLMVADMENLRTALHIDKWSILGQSFGGMLAAYYATKHPEHIDRIVMSSSGGIDLGLLSNGNLIVEKLNKTQRDSLDYWNAKIAAGDNSFATRLGRGRALAPAYLYNKKNVPTIAQRLTESNQQINGLVWQDMQRIKFNCAPMLKNYKKPVLILQGKNDILPVSIAEKIHDAFPNSQLLLLDKCAHYGWLDAPDQYLKAVNNFLN
ncbi:MAG: alpha/beta fold hydrolase [Flavobacterium sp.]|nr:MAG: alpha/beta fold hydrolase [Flavobacterium sp.]